MKTTAYICDACHTLVLDAEIIKAETAGPEPQILEEHACCDECASVRRRLLTNMYPGAKFVR